MITSQTAPSISAVDFTNTGKPVQLQELTEFYFSDPMQVENYRRLLRSMFICYMPTFEGNFGPFNQEGAYTAYEVMDELLSGLIQQASNTPKP